MKRLVSILWWMEMRFAGDPPTYYAGIFFTIVLLTGWAAASILSMTFPWAYLFIFIWVWFWTLRLKSVWIRFWLWRGNWHVFNSGRFK